MIREKLKKFMVKWFCSRRERKINVRDMVRIGDHSLVFLECQGEKLLLGLSSQSQRVLLRKKIARVDSAEAFNPDQYEISELWVN
ncbi:MAG: hypothetical protein D6719_11040 [Candidatus Dadabacteria bacterium]|nr:MAG: hypothetical protein D6719_11040 [Candidatus Dadabacteria bacterium]